MLNLVILNRAKHMNPLNTTIDDPYLVKSRLEEIFNCDQKLLLSVIDESFVERKSTTNNHPKIYGGIKQYAEGIAFLREKLIPLGYNKYSRSNSEWVQNKELGVLINFMAGNANVGMNTEIPSNEDGLKKIKSARNRNPKGTMFSLIAEPQLTGDMLTERLDIDTWCWVLMYYIDFKNQTIRSELSCPSKLTLDGQYFSEYHERIILSEISIDPESDFDIILTPDNSPEPAPSIDFAIRRKNA